MSAPTDDRNRVLQVIGNLGRGGVETWLMQVLGAIDRERFSVDVMLLRPEPAAYDDKAQALGVNVIPCPGSTRPWRFARNFRRALEQYGPYDVIHTHMYLRDGLVLRLAHGAGIPVRISHSRHPQAHRVDPLLKRAALPLVRYLVKRHATKVLAVSDESAAAFLGPGILRDHRYELLTTAIDLAPFATQGDGAALRRGLGIPPEALVVGHVARFVEWKKQDFIVRIAAELRKRRDDIYFLLIGDGPCREAVRLQALDAGVSDRFVFPGERDDVPALMTGVFDLLVFPSVSEGLGRVVVEAQAAGLPCVISDGVPRHADVVTELVCRRSLAEPPGIWADSIAAALDAGRVMSPAEALAGVMESDFNIKANVDHLQAVYDQGLADAIPRG